MQTLKLGQSIKAIIAAINGNFTELNNRKTYKVLYSGSVAIPNKDAGTSTTITLTDNPANYDGIIIQLDDCGAFEYFGPLTTGKVLKPVHNQFDMTAEKTKLSNIAANAQVNVIETVKVNGTALTPSSKAVNIDLSGKVDKVTGKGLSTNDFTDAYKNKIDGAAAVEKKTFAANGWGTADSNGYFNMTIAASGKYPVKVMRNESGVYTEALVQTAVSGNNIIVTSEETFEGYLIVI